MTDETKLSAAEQIRLRPAREEDRSAFHGILSHGEVAQWWGDPAEQLREVLAPPDDTTTFAIDVEETTVGLIQCSEELTPQYKHAGIDIAVHPDWHGRGIGPAAIRALVDHLVKDRGHHRLTIDPAADNRKAIRAYRRVGFRPVGLLRRYERAADGSWRDGLLMELVVDELAPSITATPTEALDVGAMIDALRACGPHPDVADHLQLFGQFVGSWDLERTSYAADGTTATVAGEWHFGWVLEGRAIQDVWICPARELRTGPIPPPAEWGTVIRFYDAAIDGWLATWIGPVGGVVHTFTARQDGDLIVLSGNSDDGSPLRWVFSDIEPSAFRWHSELWDQENSVWRRTVEMRVRHRDA